jgi:glucose/arabinose dehydrogenase
MFRRSRRQSNCAVRFKNPSSALAARRLAFEPLEHRQLLAATPIAVHVAGSTGTEQFQLQIDGVAVATWTNMRVLTSARVFDTFNYTHPSDVSIDRVRVALINDGRTPENADRNLFVDGVTLAGVKFESEAASVYSTGTWDLVTNGRLEGFRRTEALHYNGHLQFGAAGSVIQIHAAGRTGEEQIQLQIGGQTVATFNNVGGNYTNGQFVTLTYNSPTAIGLANVRVAFSNDGASTGGQDKNLRVDAVTLDGLRYETEAPTVYSTGVWVAGVGRAPGYRQSEYLHLNGYFQYGALASTGSVIEIRAAGRTGQEQMQLEVAGQIVATYSNVGGDYGGGQFQSFVYQHSEPVTIDQIRVHYTNDGLASSGVDKNLRVDGVLLDGVMHQAEAANVFSTGTYVQGIGRAPGLWQSEYLHANGYLQFGSTAVPGVLALGTSLVSVNESAGTVSIPVVRTGGSDGTVGLHYTTTAATATSGGDFTVVSGIVVFAPGETTKSIVVPLISDTLDEVNETFTVATDLGVGGATVNQPRTATVTIVDDDGPPTPGNGNGLLGSYYNDVALSELVFERTDATINFGWGTGSPAGSLHGDTFSIRWRGRIEPLYSETYTFRTTSDDGVRLWVNNQLIIDQWNDHGATDHFGSITLVAGQRYDVRLEYYERTGDTAMRLYWQSPSQAFQIVPQRQLFSDPPTPPQTTTFTGQTIVSGLFGPTAIDFDSSGRMFISEQQGVVRVFHNGQLQATPFLDIRHLVNNIQDRGMLGVAVHPNFPEVPYVYVSYTYDPPETVGRTGNAGPDGGGNRVARVTRWTADPALNFNRAIPGSEVVIVGTNSNWANITRPDLDSTDDMSLPPSGGNNGNGHDILIADSRSHTVGNLAFGPDGMLYVANGDGTSYGRVDARTARVQSIDSLSGKILRVDPLTGDGLSDNPFYNGDPDANRSKVYNYGLRNPFRFAFHPVTDQIYIGDVGWQAWEEINTGVGQNFGWPWYEGGDNASLQTGGYRDLPAAQSFYASNPTVRAPLWSRTHSNGAVAIVAGDFYTGSVYPSSYQNAMFLSDFGDNQIRVMRVNADGTLHSVVPINLNAGAVVEMSMGRNGYMYYVDLAGGRVGRLLSSQSATAPAETPGDFDGDGVATGDDFLAWQRGEGTGAGPLSADDLRVWSEAWGSGERIRPSLDADAFWLAFEKEEEQSVMTLLDEPVRIETIKALTPPTSGAVTLAPIEGGEGFDAREDAAADSVFERLEGHELEWRSAL